MLTEDLLASVERVARLPTINDFICSLLSCRRTTNLPHAKRLCIHILNNDHLRTNEELGDYVVPTLIECGSFSTAQQFFEKLVRPNVNSWTALVRGFNDNGEFRQAHNVLQRMQASHVQLNCHAFQAFVKTSVWLKDIEFGRKLHTEIMEKGYDSNQIISVTLIEMYVKCSSHAEAWAVLERLPAQDVVAWNILITDYADNGLGEEALKCLKVMQDVHLSPDVVTLVGSLKACTVAEDVNRGRDIHICVIKFGFERNVLVSNTLVDMYMKGSSLEDAQKVFDEIPKRTTVSWNVLLAGYAEHGLENEVLSSLDKMRSQGLPFSHVTLTCGLSYCSNVADINGGCNLHSDAVKLGFELHPSVGSSLIEMYMSVGWLDEGQQVFDMLPVHNAICWTALITGYVECGLFEAALDRFVRICAEGVSPDAFLYVCLLECSCVISAIDRVFELHCEISKDGLESDALVANALVGTYTISGLLFEAQSVFDELPILKALTCNVSASWYAEYGLDAKNLLMQVEGMLLNGTCFRSSMLLGSLKVCTSFAAIDVACLIHMRIVCQGLEKDFSLGVALVAVYAKCGWFTEARYVHEDGLPVTSVYWWNTLMLGYAEHSMADQVLICLKEMQMEGMHPNEITFMCGLKACGSLGATREGFELHAAIASEELEKDSLVGNSLIALYAKLGLLSEALEAFDELPVKDVVSWNSLMAGHADCGLDEEVLNCWEEMQAGFISPNSISFVLCLKACSSLSIVDKGLLSHEEIVVKGLESNMFIAKALVDMYAKSGLLMEAWQTFNNVSSHGLVLWNALIGGFASCGQSDLIHHALQKMQEEDVDPDEQTYTYILSLCSHGGLLKEGQMYFQVLLSSCFLSSLHEHYNCMIDLLGRAGQLNAAFAAMELLPFQPDLVTWRAILGACRKWRNVELGRHAFASVMGVSSSEASAYVLMLNMYADHEEEG